MSGNIGFRKPPGDSQRAKPSILKKPSGNPSKGKPRTPPRPGQRPSFSNLEAEPKTYRCPEDFPRILTLDLPPDQRKTDIEKLLCEMKLPQCVKLSESFAVPGCCTALNEGDVFVLHFIYDNPTVHATTAKGKKLRLPIYAEQKYELLPLDPRLDDMSYNGTQELMDADPLPAAVRVVEAHCSIRKDEDQEADEILQIQGFEEDEERGRLLVGLSGSSPFKYSTELTTSRYTTMLSPDYLRMAEIVERKFPQRLRIPDEKKDFRERNFKEEKVLHLNSFTIDKCVVATRALDNQIYSIPVSAPMKMSHLPMALKDKQVLEILPALYPLVNTTWGLVDPTQETLTTSMMLIPQPIGSVIDAWFTSEEGKQKACEVADRRVQNLKEELTSVYTEIRILKASVDSHTSSPLGSPLDQPPPPRPPRTPTQKSPTRVKQPPFLPKESLSPPPRLPPRPPNNSAPEEDYQTVEEAASPMSTQSSTNVNVMNEVREVLAKKERELHEKNTQLKQLKKQYEMLKEENANLKAASPVALYDDIPDFIVPNTGGPTRGGGNNDDYLEPNLPPRSRSLKKYTMAEVGLFLRKHDLQKYVDTFRMNGVDGKLLVSLQEEHFLDLQMSRLHALKLKLEIENMELPPLPPAS